MNSKEDIALSYDGKQETTIQKFMLQFLPWYNLHISELLPSK